MPKINRKRASFFFIWLMLIGALLYSRFVNLAWGLPYPFHPDERNMAAAIQSLSWQDKFNPHFFAYGQLPLYLGYLLSYLSKFDATLALRIISALASALTFFVILKIIKTFEKNLGWFEEVLTAVVIILSPYAIQFSHFGTTESLLMLFYSLIVYYSLKTNVFLLALFSGLAMATKASSAIFLVLPAVLLFKKPKELLTFVSLSLIIFFISSPHNFINFQDFLSSMKYESDVALGKIVVFYTRQFVGSLPVVFQFEKVFPYALGFFQLVAFLFGFIFLPRIDKKINLLRLAFLVYFLPNAFLFAKWTRFMAPVFPLMTAIALVFLLRVKSKIIFYALVLATAVPGILYLSIYQKPDTRVAASSWIYKNIPEDSYILSETANVVDIPVGGEKNYQVISFDFYELDHDPTLQEELKNYLARADYILVPSRRIFANHKKNEYPLVNKYYEGLSSGTMGFQKVAEFSAGLGDEEAEETWTVFDHPVIRIYKRI